MTRFHTERTEPQVVSTTMHSLALSLFTQSTGAPKAEEDDVLWAQSIEELVRAAVEALREEAYVHLAQAGVHGGVVDHVPRDVDAPVGELLAGLEGVVHGPVHPVAEPELVGEPDGEALRREDVAVLAQPVHDLRAVVAVEEVLDVLPHLEALAIILLAFHGHPSSLESKSLSAP